ncbi:uncharacterized protein LOC127010945 [Drosophila biarmipes]|uniref:uncharacterized protein LOC127010945 n=1 Tax=Drosophila biarmipes TaxID=125945 RepID=UPI0007E5F65A|nr:uncharacterized protein LOC127010945 [Drosophila biarmipes]
MDSSAKDHYNRIKAEMEREELLTFDDILKLTQKSPQVLTKTIKVLTRERLPAKFNLVSALKKLSISGSPAKELPDKEDDVETMTFEELVLCTKAHPLHLERSLRKIASLGQMS